MPPPSQRESPPPIDEEIYPDHEEELFRRAVSERELLNDEEDAKWWFRTLDRYKREAEMVFEGEPQRVRWHVETKLYMKTWGVNNIRGFPYAQRLPPTIAEYQELKARTANQPSQPAPPVPGGGGNGHPGGNGQSGNSQPANRQPRTGFSSSGGNPAVNPVIDTAKPPVPNETKCKCTCKCCLARCTGAGVATESMTSGTEAKDGHPAVETAQLPLSNQMKRNRPAGDPRESGQTGTSGVFRTTKREFPSDSGGQTANRLSTAPTGNTQHGSSSGVDNVDGVNTQHLKRSFSPDGCSTYTLSQAPKRLRRDGFSSVDRGEVQGDRIGAAGFDVRPSTTWCIP